MSQTNLDDWIQETCQSVCTMADLRAICTSREFTAIKKGSKAVYAEHVQMRFLQETGLENAFSTLNEESLWALHALKCIGKPMKFADLCDFFGFKRPHLYYTPDMLKNAFEKVRENLLQKGIVLIRESRDWHARNESRLLHYEVLLPESFAMQLPPPPLMTEEFETNLSFEDWRTAALDEIRHSLIRDAKSMQHDIPIVPHAQFESGALQIGDISRMAMDTLFKAIKNRWLGLTIKENNKNRYPESPVGPFASSAIPTSSHTRTIATDIGNARGHILDIIPEGHGITEENLKAAYSKFYCSLKDDAFDCFIKEGIRFGFLASTNKNAKTLLIPNLNSEMENPPPTFSVFKEAGNEVKAPLNAMSLTELLLLAQVSEIRFVSGELYARPLPILIGRLLQSQNISTRFKVLQNALPLYNQAFTSVGKRMGKIIIHTNVAVIKIASDELRNLLLSKFSEKMADLGEGHFAVSQKDLHVLITFGKKKGFTPKLVQK